MSKEPVPSGVPRCPRCAWRYCITAQCRPDAPVPRCDSAGGCHVHAICARCGFEWVSAGEVPLALRTPEQIAISIGDAFEGIVGRKTKLD